MPGPRYTSYPTADRFVEAFGANEYRQALRQRAQGAVVGGVTPLSLYIHIPFCESVCYYCACNKIITKHHERGAEYLDALSKEIDLHVAELGRGQAVSQLHFGGGSPTFLDDAELANELMAMLRARSSSRLKPRSRSRSTRARRRPSGCAPGGHGFQPHQLRRAGLRPRRAAGRASRAVVRERARPGGERAR
jgi:hypothetical protein